MLNTYTHMLCCSQLLLSCLALCDPLDCSSPGSSVHGILQGRILKGVALPSCKGSSLPRDHTHISCLSCTAGRLFTTESPGKPIYMHGAQITSKTFHLAIRFGLERNKCIKAIKEKLKKKNQTMKQVLYLEIQI